AKGSGRGAVIGYRTTPDVRRCGGAFIHALVVAYRGNPGGGNFWRSNLGVCNPGGCNLVSCDFGVAYVVGPCAVWDCIVVYSPDNAPGYWGGSRLVRRPGLISRDFGFYRRSHSFSDIGPAVDDQTIVTLVGHGDIGFAARLIGETGD